MAAISFANFFVIPGRAEGAGPESIRRSAADYGFRARSLCSRPGMTGVHHGP